MRHLVKFFLFEEINPKDISFISNEFDDYFTVSFEFEIETEDRSDIKLDFSDFDETIVDDILSMIYEDMSITKRAEKSLIKGLIYEVLDHVEFGLINVEIFNDILDEKVAKNSREIELIRHLKTVILSFIGIEDLEHLKKMVKSHLPKFYTKWYRRIEFVGDATLDRGIEIKPKKYVRSLSESIEMLNDFFSELESQKYWTLSTRTGLHINVGTKNFVEWNPIKGLLLLNDFSKKKDNTPFVFKDMTWRMNNSFCGSLLPSIYNLPDEEKNELKKSINLSDLEEAESILNNFLSEKIQKWGVKNFGFNITKLGDNYVEFRYVGGVINKEVVIDKLKYFAFIVFCMTNREYKKKEYLKKIYTFIDGL